MTFFARPDLSDIQFKQLNDSILTLSGTTKIANRNGLQLLGDVNFIPIHLTGASDGYVLTFRDGVMHLEESAASGDTFFNSQRNTTRSGIPVVNADGTTVNEFLEAYFFPAVPPTSSLSVPLPTREFGDFTLGDLTWNVTKGTYNFSEILLDNNGQIPTVYNITLLTGGDVGSTGNTFGYSLDYANIQPPSPGELQTQITYRLRAETVEDEITTSTATITWRNRKFYFRDGTQYTSSDVGTLQTKALSLTGNQAALSTTRIITINNLVFNNEFFYYMYPTLFGIPTFTVNNLLNNAWGNPDIGTLFQIVFINSKGYSNTYYVARSDSRITGTFNISVT